jgi:hypothetical protein
MRCGARESQGHGDTAICGKPYYTDKEYVCGECARKELRKTYQEKLKEIPWTEIAEFLSDNPSAYGTVIGIIESRREE